MSKSRSQNPNPAPAAGAKTPAASMSSTLRLLEIVREVIRRQNIEAKKQDPTPQAIVAFSGGKDSWAALELACKVFGNKNIHAYNLYLIPDLECELRELRKVERRYGITVHRFPHPGIATSVRAAHLQPTGIDFRRKLDHADIYRVIRHVTQADWIIFGHRIDESLQRRGMVKPSRGILAEYKKTYPLWNWSKHDVYNYLKSSRIPAPEQYTEDDTTGFTIGAQTLLYIRKKYPSDYVKVLELFPFAEVQFYRERERIKAGLKFTNHSINKRHDLQDSFNDYFAGQTDGDKSGT